MNLKKWRRHWNILKRFSPGRASNATVFECPVGVRGSLSPEEAYWIWQERGKILPSSDPVRFQELCERKSGMDLTIAMWKDTIEEYQSACSAFERIGVPQAFVLDLCGEFPVSFLNQIGILQMVGLTLKQCGLRRRKLVLA